ncbi:MAG: TonB-dependent receptor [Flavobacteriaceae bacterium]|nr:TonB-dependent receptor [Flavobacteriaceae bacterium]
MKKVILLLLFTYVGFSQTNSINGKIITKDNSPIIFANIALQSNETKIKKGTTSNEEGFFSFSEIPKGNYTITVFYLGYKNYTKQIVVNQDININSITLEEDTKALEQVEITVQKPTIIQKAGKLIFTIKNTVLSDQDSWKILNNTPSVFINKDKLLVKNNVATVYIDNKKIQLPAEELKSFLENLSGNTIKSIEVIANPSAKYDADNNAIINIVLKEIFKDSYKGSVNANYTFGKLDRYNLGTSHFYKNKNISITSNYSFTSNKNIIEESESINFFDTNNNIISNWYAATDNSKENQNHNVLFNIDYNLSKKSTVSLSTLHNFLINEENNIKTDGIVFDTQNNIESTYFSNNKSIRDNQFLSYALDFSHKLKKEGEKITTTFNYSLYDNKQEQNVNTDYFLPGNTFIRANTFRIQAEQEINIYAGQVDYTLPIKNTAKFETGVKIAVIDSENDFKQFDFSILNIEKSNMFLYDEINYAAYAKYENELETFYYQFGLRGELTNLKGNSITFDNTIINDVDYFKLFPNIVLNYYPNNKHDFVLSYKKNINRPKYSELNPFLFFFSDFAANVGNPNLRPSIQHIIDFTYVLKRKYIFNLFFSNREDKVTEISFQENDTNIVKYTNVNLNNYQSIGLLINTTNNITKRWSLFTQLFLVNRDYDFVAIESDNELINKTKFSYNIKLVNNLTLLKDKSLKASLIYQYVSSDNINGSSEISRFLKTDFTLQKQLFKNKAVLTFGIDDIFDTAKGVMVTKYKNQDIRYFSDHDTNLIKIGFRYNFGNNKLKGQNNKKTTKEEKRLEPQFN